MFSTNFFNNDKFKLFCTQIVIFINYRSSHLCDNLQIINKYDIYQLLVNSHIDEKMTINLYKFI